MSDIETAQTGQNKYTLRCPHCGVPADNKLALRSTRSEPMTCKQCGSPSWFKAPNGWPFLTVFLIVAVVSLPELLRWATYLQWIFISIAMPLVIMLDACLTRRFGRMVRLPVHPIRSIREDGRNRK